MERKGGRKGQRIGKVNVELRGSLGSAHVRRSEYYIITLFQFILNRTDQVSALGSVCEM